MKVFSSSFVGALVQPVTLLTLITSAIAGLVAAWWLFPLGLLLWVFMVVDYTRSPASRLNDKKLSRETLSNRFQQRFRKIEAHETRLYNAAQTFSSQQKRALHPVMQKFSSLIDDIHQFCYQSSLLENYYLLHTSVDEVSQQKDALLEKLASTSQNLKPGLEEELQAVEDRLDKARETTTYLTQVEGLLNNFENSLSVVIAETIYLQSMKGKESREKVQEILSLIQKEKQELENFKKQSRLQMLPPA